MDIKSTITPTILSAATALLQPFVPDLSPTALVKAIRTYAEAPVDPYRIEQPLTRKDVAALLRCTLQTVNRYMNDGRLRRIVLSPTSVRIDPASVRALLAGNATATATESEV